MVAEFDRLCEVQSDKASIEITSRYSGRVVKVHHAKGDVVKVGAAPRQRTRRRRRGCCCLEGLGLKMGGGQLLWRGARTVSLAVERSVAGERSLFSWVPSG